MKLMSNTHRQSKSISRLFVALLLMINTAAVEAASFWKDVNNTKVSKQFFTQGKALSLTARQIAFDEITFKSLSREVSSRGFSSKNIANKNIFLPLPDGTSVEVTLSPSVVMTEKLAAKFPEINTWDVKGVSKDITGSVDFSSRGLHGMLIMPDGDSVFIEPENRESRVGRGGLSAERSYISFSKNENKDDMKIDFSCGVHDSHKDLSFAKRTIFEARPASDLITYRLAVATTGEYSQYHGGTVEDALGAVVTTISRVNQIFKRDLSIQFELVEEQEDLIYLDPDTDPYTNLDIDALIDENNANLSATGALSETQYDIGHVFARGNVGGLVVFEGVCGNAKAFGATGISSPVGDAFSIDYVAHELGHQLGGSHTFNSFCGGNREASFAVEPGSGSTIMAYPGICGTNDIQDSADPQFHIASIKQIRSFTRLGDGSSCSVSTSTINENPTVNAGADMTVPARTPLVFVAEGADTDNDELTYAWEQSDTGTMTNVNVDAGDNALFRSRPLTTNNVRFIPPLEDLFSSTVSPGEVLPVTNRDINMVATVRDGKGGLQDDLVTLQVFDTGESFSLTSHFSAQSYARGNTTQVNWNVAGTDSSPISCADVDIGLVTIDGEGLDIVTAPNDGTELITIPNNAPAMSNARFIVSCSNSNFFAVSLGGVTILDQDGNNTGTGTTTDISSSGGGSSNYFMLLLSIVLIAIRKYKGSLKKLFNQKKSVFKACLLSVPILVSVQACSNPAVENNQSSNAESATPQEFDSRFSTGNIKKEREAYYAQKLSELKQMNPSSEVKKALRLNDLYYLAVAAGRGSSLSIPGLVEPQATMVNCKTKTVEGMGDVLYGTNHIQYRQEMLRYMRDFNTLMQAYCK